VSSDIRILSLLPSATEIVFALGLEDNLVGVTHECDWPPAASAMRAVTRSALPPAATPDEIDRLVSATVSGGDPIYTLDTDAVAQLKPDLVLSQDLCKVCAVPSGHVNEALDTLGCRAEVVSLDPGSLDEVLQCVVAVGEATGIGGRAKLFVDSLRERLAAVSAAVEGLERPRTFALEWSDPPFNGGHWVPDMIDISGGLPVLSTHGVPSFRVGWDQIRDASSEVVVFMPCGYDTETASEEAATFAFRDELEDVSALYAVDASAYFSRPGPRLVDGVELLASVLHPGSVPDAPAGRMRRIR
jgi:iron complex transport system substrate-binding protein